MPDLPRGGGWLFVETVRRDAGGGGRRGAASSPPTATAWTAPCSPGPKAAALWRIREDGAGLGGRTPDGAPAWPGWEDSAVPPPSLGPYLRELPPLMAAHGVDGLLYGHFGDGCVHVRIDFPLRDRPRVLRSFTEDAAKLAASYGGSASGEHGDGRARGELLPLMYSAAAMGLLRAVKQLFDPGNLLNPGIIVDPAPLDADLRVPLARPLRRGLGFAYPHDAGDFTTAVHRCTGVGKCRADTTASGGVMCPSYLATRDEKDSTRGRARVLQELANGGAGLRLGRTRRSPRRSTCACPARAARPTARPASTWPPTRPRRSTSATGGGCARRRTTPSAGCRAGPRSPRGHRGWPGWPTRRCGCARRGGAGQAPRRHRPAPRPAARSRRRASALVRGTRPAPARPRRRREPVLLWVDTFTNAFSPRRRPGRRRGARGRRATRSRITGQNVCCGLTWISTGQLDGARRQLRRTLRALTPALDAGIPIVGLEPSCTAALRGDAAELLPGDRRARRRWPARSRPSPSC